MGGRRKQEISIKRVELKQHGFSYETWEVHGYRADGTRIRIRCKSEDEARMRKSEEETQAINAERATRFIQTRLSAAQLSEAEACFDRLAPKYSLTDATDYFLRNFHAPDFTITVGEASVKFRSSLEGRVRDVTLKELKSTLGQFERFTDNCNVHEVTAELVERFLHGLRGRDGVSKASLKTWNNVRGDLHELFRWCREQRFVSLNPVTDIKRFKIDRGHIEVLTVKQCHGLMDHVETFRDGKLIPYFSLALFGGIRPEELKKLAHSPQLVDIENKVVRITPAISKTRQSRQIKIRPTLLKWLKRFQGDIFPVNANRELKDIRKQLRLSHDVLRHTFISNHIASFGSFADCALESGNSEKIIRDHYLNVVPKSQAKAFWKIEPKP